MAVTECKLQRAGRHATFELENKREYELSYLITTDNKMESDLSVLGGAHTASPDALPTLLSIYNAGGIPDAAAYCLRISLDPSDTDTRWIAKCHFGPLPPGQDPEENPENPLLRPVRYHIEYHEETITYERDVNGDPIANTVGDTFDEPLEEPIVYMTLVAVKNYATLQQIINIGLQYHDTVNSDTFYGAPARTVRFLPIECGEQQQENGIRYYQATLRFMFKPNRSYSPTWDRVIMNTGWRGRQEVGGAIMVLSCDETRLQFIGAPKLTAQGLLLPEGQDPHWLTFQTREAKAYGGIGV